MWILSRLSAPATLNPTTTLCCHASSSLSKRKERLLRSIEVTGGDPLAVRRLLCKFSGSSSKALQLEAFHHLLSSHQWAVALPMYKIISEAPWYKWNGKLIASLIGLLEKYEQREEALSLLGSETIKKLGPRDLATFYCNLIDSYSEHGLKNQVLETYSSLKKLPYRSGDALAYKSIINGFSLMNLPHHANEMLDEMMASGFKASPFEFRSLILAYGRCGFFPEMEKTLELMENLGYSIDTVTANTILSSYGSFMEYSKMVSWLKKMASLNVDFSIRTYNSVVNSCPTILSIVQQPQTVPLSINELLELLNLSTPKELFVIQEFLSSVIQLGSVNWASEEWRLDLHGMHTGAAYVILLQWFEEMKERLYDGTVIPLEVSVVTGTGKHSSVRGESTVKKLVSEMMFQMGSPLKVDRLNVGRFVARGKAVKTWLS
ncbi:hypothetical protein AMTRI_Chr09g15080 [Amborella trichopoda]